MTEIELSSIVCFWLYSVGLTDAFKFRLVFFAAYLTIIQ